MPKNFNSEEAKEFLKSQMNSTPSETQPEGEIIPIDFSVVESYEKSDLLAIEDPDTLIASVNNITETYERFGREYNIDIKYDVNSVSSTFKSLISNDAEEVFKVYLSKSFSKMKLSVFNKILISITTLVDRITQKEILESDNIELSVGLVEKLMDMMEKINRVYEEIEIKSSDTVLKQLSKNLTLNGPTNNSDLSNDEIMRTLRQIKLLKNK